MSPIFVRELSSICVNQCVSNSRTVVLVFSPFLSQETLCVNFYICQYFTLLFDKKNPQIPHSGILGWTFAKLFISKELSLFHSFMINSLYSTDHEWSVFFPGNKELQKTCHPPIHFHSCEGTQGLQYTLIFDRMLYDLYFVWLKSHFYLLIVSNILLFISETIVKNTYKKHQTVKVSCSYW